MTLESFSLARYRIPLDSALPVGKQRIELRQGLILQARANEQDYYVEIAPLSGLDRDGSDINGFSLETLDQAAAELQNLLQAIIEGTLDLDSAAELTKLASVAWGLSLLSAKINNQLPVHHTPFEPVPLIVPREGEPEVMLRQRLSTIPTNIHRVKIKVAQTNMAEELKLIHLVQELRPEVKLRLDANQGFEFEEAEAFCACLPKNAIEYIEEPCRQWQKNRALFASTGVPFALDETLGRHPDFEPAEDAYDSGLRALVIKPMLCGSLPKLQKLIDQAHNLGLRCVLSSSIESTLGIADILRIAAALTPDDTPGVDTVNPFTKALIEPYGDKTCLAFDSLTPVFSVRK
ncbi:o-succinylbenzoate synthase [Shewanella avicenniae]|uniref:o-succinylbenzoate synthase n=1 Tax=Shewanella avicenniae TaxID=2814294 RepID=A0ABX7QQV2_9GAMM|nr:o-succinylbenzoate synthase [Shewanella avicenniae]QSX33841.1 o-succinylbenzoate synthase [Shewanella avicenniae]